MFGLEIYSSSSNYRAGSTLDNTQLHSQTLKTCTFVVSLPSLDNDIPHDIPPNDNRSKKLKLDHITTVFYRRSLYRK